MNDPRSFRPLAYLAGVVVALAAPGCSEGPIDVPQTPVVLVDAEPAWSHDGRTIAFVRADSSSLGAAGVYAMAWPERTIRLVRALDPEGIRGLRFAGDDQSLIAGWNGTLVRFDLATGAQTTLPVGTTSAVLPDETADGSAIVYVRPSSPTGTLWQYEPAVPRDSVLRIDGGVSFGSFPRFSPGDSLVVYAEPNGIHVLRRISGQGIRVTQGGVNSLHTIPRWLDERRILFNAVSASGQRYFVIDRYTGAQSEVPLGIFDSEAISPAGDSILVQGYDQTDPGVTYIVLYVRGLASESATARQITSFQP